MDKGKFERVVIATLKFVRETVAKAGGGDDDVIEVLHHCVKVKEVFTGRSSEKEGE